MKARSSPFDRWLPWSRSSELPGSKISVQSRKQGWTDDDHRPLCSGGSSGYRNTRLFGGPFPGSGRQKYTSLTLFLHIVAARRINPEPLSEYSAIWTGKLSEHSVKPGRRLSEYSAIWASVVSEHSVIWGAGGIGILGYLELEPRNTRLFRAQNYRNTRLFGARNYRNTWLFYRNKFVQDMFLPGALLLTIVKLQIPLKQNS